MDLEVSANHKMKPHKAKVFFKIKQFIKNNFFRNLAAYLILLDEYELQISPEYLEWCYVNVAELTNEFVSQQNLRDSISIKKLNMIFKTRRFEQLLNKWIGEYLTNLFDKIYEYYHTAMNKGEALVLEDNPINHFGVEKYCSAFNVKLNIYWAPQFNFMRRVLSIFVLMLYVLIRSINSGIKISGEKKKYKVMREALWGLYGRGYFFHDDFLVDGKIIEKDDLLLFSREIMMNDKAGRMEAYYDAKKSGYAAFFLPSLKIGIKELFFRVIPKYIISGSNALRTKINSPNFSLFENIFYYFILYALPYEKVFSNFRIVSELGHNYFSSNHIPEAIVCGNYGVKYYLMHWSDLTLVGDHYLLSSLGCDYFLLWGRIHITGVEGDYAVLKPTGYVFKKFINWVKLNRQKVLCDMKIKAKGKIITFFDECFGGVCKMTENHHITFWETALKLAQEEKGNTILVKPKGSSRYLHLSDALKEKFIKIKNTIESMDNAFIIDETKWSFIEAIGISDIVISQSMTSSTTIAIICGIEGLYLDEANYSHPFAKNFKNKVVFDDPQKLLDMVTRIIRGKDSALQNIPQSLIREYDEYSDDRGIQIFRELLSRG